MVLLIDAANVIGSFGLTVFNIEAMPRVRAVAKTTPSAIPTKANFNPCVTIMRVTLEGLAPSAMRIPIS